MTGVFLVTKAVLGHQSGMVAKQQGVILNMSSAAGVVAIPGMSIYNASKWGLEGMTKVHLAH